MIEVERKFLIDGVDEKRLTQGATFLKEVKFTDTYYDTADFQLTTRDWWLRKRDGNWELKIAVIGRMRNIDHYDEIIGGSAILTKLRLPKGEIGRVLQEHSYSPFSTYTTIRRKYRKGQFVIDLDLTDFGYKIIEVERRVMRKEEIPQAVQQILNFAKEYSLQSGYIRGKVIEYIKRNSGHHYRKLVEAGIVKERP